MHLFITVTGAGSWAHVAGAWAHLAHHARALDWFGTAAFLSRWCDCFGESLQTRGMLWHTDGEVAGVALISVRKHRRGPFTVRQAILNAAPDTGIMPEHQRLLTAPGRLQQVAASLVQTAKAERWDELVLCGFDLESSTAVLDAAGVASDEAGHQSESRYIRLDRLRNERVDFVSTRTASVRARIRRSLREYRTAHGALRLEVARTPQEQDEYQQELEQLHQQCWQTRNQQGAFASGSFSNFVEAARTEEALGKSFVWLRVRAGETVIAVLLCAVHEHRVLFMQSGLRYEESAHCRPGLVAHAMAADWFAAEGYDEYDFLAGERETPRYKLELSDASRPVGFYVIPFPTPTTRLILALRRARWLMRHLVQRATVQAQEIGASPTADSTPESAPQSTPDPSHSA